MESMPHDKYEKTFEQSSFRQYWIINKNEEAEFDEAAKIYSNVYGPYDKEKYLQKRRELGVPNELQLKD